MKLLSKTITMAAATTLLLLSGCSEEDDKTEVTKAVVEVPATKEVKIYFSPEVENRAINCASNFHVGSGEANATLKDFRMFISEVALLNESGKKVDVTLDQNDWQYENVALLDFEDGTAGCAESGNTPDLRAYISGKVPEGIYSNVAFTLGVPKVINHNKYPDVKMLNHSKMDWGWQNGRKFMKLEVVAQSENAKAWNFHLGSTDCSEDATDESGISCNQSNRVSVVLDNFNIEMDTVKMDLGSLFQSSDVAINLGEKPGCMSFQKDPDCEQIFSRLDLPYGEETNGECKSEGCKDQALFSVKKHGIHEHN
jgi:uncharacterized repeat protein (TIGR04052 family)